MAGVNIGLKEAEGSLTLESSLFSGGGDAGESQWMAVPLDYQRIMLHARASRDGMADKPAGIANCSVDVFADFLTGLTHRRWSGVVSIDTRRGVKKLFFRDGELCFARSNVIDDRLGEVIYRSAKITLDQLTESAVQVTRENKFGQVLLKSGIFSTVDLWEALKSQVREIVRSVFLVPSVYFEIEQEGLAPTEVVYSEGTRAIIDDCYSFGSMFRDFLARISPETQLAIREDKRPEIPPVGSFMGDFLSLLQENPRIEDIVKSSKLMDINTYAAVMTVVNKGFCTIPQGAAKSGQEDLRRRFAGLTQRVADYHLLLQLARQAFQDQQTPFPIEDLYRFTETLNTSIKALFLNENGELDGESQSSIYSQCEASVERVDFFVIRIESLIQFLLQVTSDLIPFSAAKAVRTEFRAQRQ